MRYPFVHYHFSTPQLSGRTPAQRLSSRTQPCPVGQRRSGLLALYCALGLVPWRCIASERFHLALLQVLVGLFLPFPAQSLRWGLCEKAGGGKEGE